MDNQYKPIQNNSYELAYLEKELVYVACKLYIVLKNPNNNLKYKSVCYFLMEK
jgi:hypothetical protein